MCWGILRVAKISLWKILLLDSGNLELANATNKPCYHHIDAAYDYQLSNPFCLCQVNKLQHAVPVQQGYTKLHLTMKNITHPQMNTIRSTLSLDISKRGSPIAPRHPRSAGSSQRHLDAHINKELGLLPSLSGECQVVRIGKRSPKQQWLKDKEEKSLQKQNKRRSKDQTENLR